MGYGEMQDDVAVFGFLRHFPFAGIVVFLSGVESFGFFRIASVRRVFVEYCHPVVAAVGDAPSQWLQRIRLVGYRRGSALPPPLV